MKNKDLKSLTDEQLKETSRSCMKKVKTTTRISIGCGVAALLSGVAGIVFGVFNVLAGSIALFVIEGLIVSVLVPNSIVLARSIKTDNKCTEELNERKTEREISFKVLQEIKTQEQARQVLSKQDDSQQISKKQSVLNEAEISSEPQNE